MENLREKANELGFLDIGAAPAEMLEKESENYKSWINSGMNAGMEWMERNIDKRRDIRQILPGAKSVIVAAYSYFTGHGYPDGENSGKISRYAWNFDYHDILRPKLDELGNHLVEMLPGEKFLSYVDTGPILEKSWAEKAGIGWQGKNSLILSKNAGSYFFLGIIITTAVLPFGEPAKDYCLSCTKCIDACPTDAIIDDKVVDSRKCISYWTIESKPGEKFPPEISKNLNGWLFGCDICQEVCPWNRHKPVYNPDTRFHPRLNQTTLGLEEIESMEQGSFSRRFSKSPIKRAKIAGLKRNAREIGN